MNKAPAVKPISVQLDTEIMEFLRRNAKCPGEPAKSIIRRLLGLPPSPFRKGMEPGVWVGPRSKTWGWPKGRKRQGLRGKMVPLEAVTT